MTSIADLIAEVAAEHHDNTNGDCEGCWQDWPCDAARLAAALSVENVAAGLMRTGHCGSDHERASLRGLVPEEHGHEDCLYREPTLADAAALLAAMTVAG